MGTCPKARWVACAAANQPRRRIGRILPRCHHEGNLRFPSWLLSLHRCARQIQPASLAGHRVKAARDHDASGFALRDRPILLPSAVAWGRLETNRLLG